MKSALAYADRHRERHLTELKAFLRLPSISAQPAFRGAMEETAVWLRDAMAEAGLDNTAIIETIGKPLVYGDWLHAGPEAPTVLVYGHYDVQPPEPLELWQTPPFEPTIIGDHIHARGAADDKGQLYIHVKAAQAYLQAEGRLPVNVRYIFEGEEESGGRGLAAFVREQGARLAADVALVSDSHILAPDQPALVYGLRGIVYLYLTLEGADRDLHSGSYGGAVDNPLNAMAHIIARLRDPDGRILVPGFYDRVRPLSTGEREALNRRPTTAATVMEETGAAAEWGEPGYTAVERMGARPTLDVHGIVGGYMGPGGKTVLPARAEAKISMRLVPDQDPQRVYELFRRYVESLAPPTMRLSMRNDHGAPATIVDLETPALKAAAAAYETTFGNAPLYIRGGGSIPVVGDFQTHLGLETVLMGFGLPNDRIHSPNERFYLPNFQRGIAAIIRFLAIYGGETGAGG